MAYFSRRLDNSGIIIITLMDSIGTPQTAASPTVNTTSATEIVIVIGTATGNETAIGSAGARTLATATQETTVGTIDHDTTAGGHHPMNVTTTRAQKPVVRDLLYGIWILGLITTCRRHLAHWMAVLHLLTLMAPDHLLKKGRSSLVFIGRMTGLWMLVLLALSVKSVLLNPDSLAR